MTEDIESIVNEYNEFLDDLGPDSRITVGLDLDADPEKKEYVAAALWPKGTAQTGVPAVRATGRDFSETLQCLKDGWREGRSNYRQHRMKHMAMLVITLTDAKGSCTHDDLVKIGKFSEEEIKDYAVDAVTMANNMMSKGPFQLT